MKKNVFGLLLSVSFLIGIGMMPLAVNAQEDEFEDGMGGSGLKACKITVYSPGHTNYKCKGRGEACSNVLECLQYPN